MQATLIVVTLALTLASAATAQTETVLHSFTGGSDGGLPLADLVMDSSGNLYGTVPFPNNGLVYQLTPNGSGGWTQNIIYSFTGGVDGFYPKASVTLDRQGNLYGTCLYGGVGGGNGNGAVFELSPGAGGVWTLTRYYDFTGGADGSAPTANVILDSAGNVYGTASAGGEGYGTVFKLTPSGNTWTEQTLHTFTNGVDGNYPYSGMIMDIGGNLYGTTVVGGATGNGVVFKLHHTAGGSWIETVLYAFTGNSNGTDGSAPYGSLAFDSVGRIYGTTFYNTSTRPRGSGGVFRLNPSAIAASVAEQQWQITWLYHFTGAADGGDPWSAPVFDSAGNLYGTTLYGGTMNNETCGGYCGVVYKLTASPTWSESALWTFTGESDGGNPNGTGPLVFDNAGNLYGTTFSGGLDNFGVAFQLTP
jgi:uncharacterized repeat protein (TIGR03803 family)